MKDPVFEPIMINRTEIKNRIYLPAMHLGMTENYFITDRLVHFYEERAKGGAGMIAVGFATIDELSGNPMCIGAHTDEYIPGLTRLASAINDNGAKSIAQINHAGRYTHSFLLDGKQPVAPSPIASRLTRETPRELPIEEIKQIVESFARAAERVKKAGYDGVEVLSGTGYLISEFLSPVTNQRADEYGGSLDNRMRFGLEIMQAIRKTVGEDFPLLVRMNGNDFMPGGQGREELKEYAKLLAGEGTVNALNINVGWHEARVPQIVTSVPRGVFGYMSRGIKDVVDIPVIASHRINDIETARELLSNDMCDMVAIGRGLIADPYLPEKAKTGRENEIIHCIACAQGCFDHLPQGKIVECLCNPKAGHEKERIIEKTSTPKKVMIVGGGPAGMSAALAANEKGHQVTICEKDDRLGGQLFLAAAPPGREEFAELAKDLETQVNISGVNVMLKTEVDDTLLEKEKPDTVILATGAAPVVPSIPGVDLPHVVQSWDVLLDKVHTGKNVVVIGGGAVGVETALFLSEKGTLSGEAIKFLMVNQAEDNDFLYELATRGTKEIVLVEMLEKVGTDIGKTTRWTMLQDMSRHGVTIKVAAKALEITDSTVKIECDGKTEEIPADTVVLAVGAQSYNPLQATVEKLGIPCEAIGDANQIALAFDAVHEGFNAGREI
ncbi:MAG: FAD-dependent oxidoreductase [Deltaproteobacteria bacterium]|nr:FAD-dependent oxidoreductase [Deltaproteobacteria bacterium]